MVADESGGAGVSRLFCFTCQTKFSTKIKHTKQSPVLTTDSPHSPYISGCYILCNRNLHVVYCAHPYLLDWGSFSTLFFMEQKNDSTKDLLIIIETNLSCSWSSTISVGSARTSYVLALTSKCTKKIHEN